ncbi:uncharacterized protein [Antedon mediterranea]|uniref:uncharacterized protein n=1 Tax=Antedon mediterranea TaxID=105859 RepID=UPI003AF67A54
MVKEDNIVILHVSTFSQVRMEGDIINHECTICKRKFTVKSNLTRHMKIHGERKNFKCDVCLKTYTLKQYLDRHKKVHQYPSIALFKEGEARLKCSKEALNVAGMNNTNIDPVWLDPKTAETAAKKSANNDLWQSAIVITFGKYMGQSFNWLLENDVGYTVWLLYEFCQNGDKCLHMKWQKEQLLQFVSQFPAVKIHLDNRLKKYKETQEPPTDMDPDYIEDAELLALADNLLQQSEVPVTSKLTTVEKIVPVPSTSHSFSTATSDTSQDGQTSLAQSISSVSDPTILEGWQKVWEEPAPLQQGIMLPNVKWFKYDMQYGLFQYASPQMNAKGEMVKRKVCKPKMHFNPPPIPTAIKGELPNMLAFFSTPVFFWRPVGIMGVKVKCPNPNCPAPPDTYLSRCGFGNNPRQVCGLNFHYTLLTERLQCSYCMHMRKAGKADSDKEKDGKQQERQYRWLAYSADILMNLAPAVRTIFPAIVCGKRAIDRNVVSLLTDRLNAVSMTKCQRMLQHGHDEWYAERRDMYQTLLFQAHTSTSSASQPGILPFIKSPGSYTPPVPQTPVPSPRVLRRAHLIMEMEKMSVYRASILSVTGEILCIDGTKQILKKIYGDGKNSMQYLTSVLNEWGQFVTTVAVAAESESCYKRMACGLIARFKRANAPAPKIIYADNNCCSDGGTAWLERLFEDWANEGMVVRLDIRHWLHRWDAVVIKQSHAKYGSFMSALAGAILAYNKDDMLKLVGAVRNSNEELYSQYSDQQMMYFVKPYQLKSYVRRITRGVEVSAVTIEVILQEFKGPAGLDIDGVHLFKSLEAVDAYWATASKHLSCMQDPPNIPLYVITKEVTLNGVKLNKYRCRRGSNSLEGLHAHMFRAIPSQRCGIAPFQVYLIAFAVQWNNRMESLKVTGGRGRITSCVDPRQIQRLNQQAEVLFGREHMYEPNFTAPMPYPDKSISQEEEELLGLEYAYCQSTDFTSKDYYIKKVEEEQVKEDEGEEEQESEAEDEGVDVATSETDDDPIDHISVDHVALNKEENRKEESPAMQDVLMAPSHLHLPGFIEVEHLAMLLLELTDDSNFHIIPVSLRRKIADAAGKLSDHDRSAANFVKKYESRWGYTLFGRCLGPDSPMTSAAQKTKFGWMRYAQAAQINEDSRLLYLIIKMLRNRPNISHHTSPTKTASLIKGQYKRIVDRVRDDPILSGLQIPLPNINMKSITNFFSKQEKQANFTATSMPKVVSHKRVFSDALMPDALTLPSQLSPPDRPQVQYPVVEHVSGKRRYQKCRSNDAEVLQPECLDNLNKPSNSSLQKVLPKPATTTPSLPVRPSGAILLIVPSQAQGPSVTFKPSTNQCLPFSYRPPPTAPPKLTPYHPRSQKPCSVCHVPKCGGLRKRYTPSREKTENSEQKIFTFCPTSRRSTTLGFDEVYDDFDHFKRAVDEKLLGHSM